MVCLFNTFCQHNNELKNDFFYLRVPADKHPQIAPNEFANFIKTHGANTPSRKSSSLRRRKSILSQSLSVKSNRLPENQDIVEEEDEDEDDLNRTLSEKKRQFLKKVMNDSEKLKCKSLEKREAIIFAHFINYILLNLCSYKYK